MPPHPITRSPRPPLIGVTAHREPVGPRAASYESATAYIAAVVTAGGVPLILPHEAAFAGQYADLCDGFVLTGGDDCNTEPFGQPPHPKACLIPPERQTFELALLDALAERPSKPVLGICLGMQFMALHAGGRLDPHLPDTLGEEAAALHQTNRRHPLLPVGDDEAGWLKNAFAPDVRIVSSHHQAVADAGSLRVLATAEDGTIEAVAAPSSERPFYLGVQWHPERDNADPLTRQLFSRLVAATRAAAPAPRR